MMRQRRWHSKQYKYVSRLLPLLAVVLVYVSACTTVPVPAAAPHAPEISAEAAARADELLELGRTIEPDLTDWLVAGADRLDLHLCGLRHRVKSRTSLERKIQTDMLSNGIPAEEVIIGDVLRYTMLVADDPPGRYNDVVSDILERIENRGYIVREVDNYLIILSSIGVNNLSCAVKCIAAYRRPSPPTALSLPIATSPFIINVFCSVALGDL